MLYDKDLFQKLCHDMGLELDYSPDYDAAIQRMKEFYPAMADDSLNHNDVLLQEKVTLSSPRVTFSQTTQRSKYLPADITLEVA